MESKYMDNNKDDKYYIEKMKIHFERLLEAMDNVSYKEYASSIDKQDITMFNLIQISENAKMISSKYRNSKLDIPWTDIYGLRNRIVHDYGNVILEIVYKTLTEDIPDLYKKLYK